MKAEAIKAVKYFCVVASILTVILVIGAMVSGMIAVTLSIIPFVLGFGSIVVIGLFVRLKYVDFRLWLIGRKLKK
ncbi:hypothetical protein A1QO_02505 [Vibrio genomosp. F10 str. ZF-129]|uniref:Uncharacterized protein n=1 Tax=Vibrio genomosp. F10 str. ZF-129 TaxID=1187848 RepID=A0A1E5BK40_9VIBR|nr:hypothetical protein [Vibrio genomosp. F10]OEE38268.1 hypothetical protein A1QO_02505 [Vibrio genomosp. F10 str. ZF-129]